MVRPFLFTEEFTAEVARTLFSYDPITGSIRYLTKRDRHQIGDIATRKRVDGYNYVCLSKRKVRANRLAFLLVTGEWPFALVDHKNNDHTDDRWENLRPATKSQNSANSKRPVTNTTGFKGVKRQNRKFSARIRYMDKQMHLGMFDTAEEAHEAYMAAARKYFGEFARAA